MNFNGFCQYLEKLEGTASRNDMTVILAEMFEKTSPEDARLVAYMCQGKLGPAYKSPDFGVADKSMVKALGEEAQKIFHQTGDLGKTVERLKSQSTNPKSQIKFKPQEIKHTYAKLWEIATISGTGSQDTKQKLIMDLLNDLDPVSAKYTVKMILGKLRTGFSDMTILDSLSWMLTGDKKLKPKIEAMYNVRADLGEVAELTKNLKLEIRNLKIDPKIGTPVLMARAERAVNAKDIWERNGECAVEYKLDGLRIQAHVGDTVTLFSRGLEDVTSMYPDVVEGLKKQIKHNCIVEGEMIAVAENGHFLPFQETSQRKRKYDIEEMTKKIPLKIYLFDILFYDGKSLLNEPNEKRRRVLEKIVSISPLRPPLNLRGGNPKGGSDTVQLMTRINITSEEEIETFFQKAIKDGTEGIIAKKNDGPYQAGARDFNWIKYKKSYQKSALSDTIDVVIMGYDEGQGKRSKFGIGDFLAGVYDSSSDKYFTVAKIGTGLTDSEWIKTKSSIINDQSSSKPENYEVSNQMKCDHWVKPKIVVEILADEITKSPMHTSSYALRFPRLVSFREKKPEDTTSPKEIEKMYKMQFTK